MPWWLLFLNLLLSHGAWCLSGSLQVPCLLVTAYSSGVKLELRLKLEALILSCMLTLSAFLSLQEMQGAAAPRPCV